MIKGLPADLETFVQQELASGKYQSEDELVAQAVRLLKEHETPRETPQQTYGGMSDTPSFHTVGEVLRDITRALETGAFVLARRLATEGARRYPQHAELQKYARVLAPPLARRASAAAPAAVKANGAWLKAHRQDYIGQWVALRDGQLVRAAHSLDDLVKDLGKTAGLLLTKIMQ